MGENTERLVEVSKYCDHISLAELVVSEDASFDKVINDSKHSSSIKSIKAPRGALNQT